MTFEKGPEGSRNAYAGAGLHRVAQVAAEGVSQVLRVVAAGQLGQTLRRRDNSRSQREGHTRNHASGSNPAWIPPHLIFASDPDVAGLRGERHEQLRLVGPALALIPGVESQR